MAIKVHRGDDTDAFNSNFLTFTLETIWDILFTT